MMRKMTIKNDFTNRQTWVDIDRPFSKKRIKRIRARSCRPGCTSGDILGARGRQDNPELYVEIIEKLGGVE